MADIPAHLRVRASLADMWPAIVAMGDGITSAAVAERTGASQQQASDYLVRLCKAGFLAEADRSPVRNRRIVYRLARSARDAPRVRRDGAVLPEPFTEIAWRTIKIQRVGITVDGIATAIRELGREPKRTHLQNYVLLLARAGVLARTTPQKGNRPAVYRLALPLGARAPIVLLAIALFDPNSKTVLGVAEASEAP